MFTGIIEEVGTVLSMGRNSNGALIRVGCKKILQSVSSGASIAVNGVCLTVTSLDESSFQADVSNESLRVTSLGSLSVGSRVNTERAMAVNGRFDGHMVAGHVDTTARIAHIHQDGNSVHFRLQLQQPEYIRYFIERGSAAIDGVSLTVFQIDTHAGQFSFNLIPHSQFLTTLPHKSVGDLINVECDLVAKYIERLLGFQDSEKIPAPACGGVTMDFLRNKGFA